MVALSCLLLVLDSRSPSTSHHSCRISGVRIKVTGFKNIWCSVLTPKPTDNVICMATCKSVLVPVFVILSVTTTTQQKLIFHNLFLFLFPPFAILATKMHTQCPNRPQGVCETLCVCALCTHLCVISSKSQIQVWVHMLLAVGIPVLFISFRQKRFRQTASDESSGILFAMSWVRILDSVLISDNNWFHMLPVSDACLSSSAQCNEWTDALTVCRIQDWVK